MNIKRITPRMSRTVMRARAAVLYALGKIQGRNLEHKISTLRRELEAMDSKSGGNAVRTLRLVESLEQLQQQLVDGSLISPDRASVLARYATGKSAVTEATWCDIAGIGGWSTGDAFFSGVTSPQTADREMVRFASSSKRGGHPIEHLVASWPSHERPSSEQMLHAANRLLELSGVPRDCPRVLAIHRDTDNLHVHVVLSRYRPAHDSVWSAPRWIDALHRSARQVEIEQGFSHDNGNSVVVEVDGVKHIVDRRYQRAQLSAEAAQYESRNLKPSFERYVRESRHKIEQVLADSRDWNGVHRLLAARLAIGLKRHGKGFAITNLSEPEVYAKASLGGLSAPRLESLFGPWRQLGSPVVMQTLRTLAAAAPSRYQPVDAVIPSPISAATQQKRGELRSRVITVGEARQANRVEALQRDFERTLMSAGSGTERRRIERDFAQRRQRALKEERRERRAALDAVDRLYAVQQRTPLQLSQLDPDAVDSDLVPRIPRAGTPALLIVGIRVQLFVVQLPGLQGIRTEQGIEYRRGGDTVICDDGERVHVHSELSADIADALAILVATRPEIAERGVTLTGSDEFRDRAMRAIARAGLTVANADYAMQQQFSFIQEQLRAELTLTLPTSGLQQYSKPSMG
ncbi:MAG: relaxase/mobilization nuclease domain-containing protein [Pseudomonadaceae bacterium]